MTARFRRTDRAAHLAKHAPTTFLSGKNETGILGCHGKSTRVPGHFVLTSLERFLDMRNTMIKGLHHNAYRCRDSEETRKFYEDFMGLELTSSLAIGKSATGRETQALHTFYQLDDGSFLAFFEVPSMPFEFKEQHDFDLHIALEVQHDDMMEMFEKGKAAGMEVRGVSDHHFVDSIYFRDPNGYVIELTAKRDSHDDIMLTDNNAARDILDTWQAAK